MTDLFDFLGADVARQFDDLAGPEWRRYLDAELGVIRPALSARGFGKIRFADGERDSFGPLSRIVTAVDQAGHTRTWCYG